jgi:hypothetical protein
LNIWILSVLTTLVAKDKSQGLEEFSGFYKGATYIEHGGMQRFVN